MLCQLERCHRCRSALVKTEMRYKNECKKLELNSIDCLHGRKYSKTLLRTTTVDVPLPTHTLNPIKVK